MKRSQLNIRGTSIFLFILCMTARSAAGDIIYYPDQFGAQVTFTSIHESSSSIGSGAGQVPELYGPPVGVNHNTLVFRPSLYEAKSVGAAISLIDGQLSFTVCAHPGYLIDRIVVNEFGDYTVATPFPGGFAFVAHSVTGIVSTSAGTFTDSSFFSVSHNHSISPGIFGALWSQSIDIAIPPTRCADFDMDNTLVAASTHLAAAIIKKKRVEITVFVVPVPEPHVATPLLFAAIVFALKRRFNVNGL